VTAFKLTSLYFKRWILHPNKQISPISLWWLSKMCVGVFAEKSAPLMGNFWLAGWFFACLYLKWWVESIIYILKSHVFFTFILWFRFCGNMPSWIQHYLSIYLHLITNSAQELSPKNANSMQTKYKNILCTPIFEPGSLGWTTYALAKFACHCKH
jgi:hypothetical protein